MSAQKVFPGQVYGRLTVLAKGEYSGHTRFYLCRCQCGVEREIRGGDLLNGDTISCGCWKKQQAAALHWSHGATSNGHRTPEYRVWASMVARCTNPKSNRFASHGARGITVCEQWREFPAFLAYVGPRPSAAYSLDRIDNEGNYEHGNVRWATAHQQAQNTRRTKLSSSAIDAIRVRVSAGETYVSIARDFGMWPSSIRRAVLGLTWPIDPIPKPRARSHVEAGLPAPGSVAA